MKEYRDVGVFLKRPGQEKAFFLKLGSAQARDDGGFWINLDALPLPNAEGRVTLSVSGPKDPQASQRRMSLPPRRSRSDDLPDDEIPF